MSIEKLRKRDGRLVAFDPEKIAGAINKAFAATYKPGYEDVANKLAGDVVSMLEVDGVDIPDVEHVQDMVEKVLMDSGYVQTAKAYILYRNERSRAREMNTRLMKVYEDITFSSGGRPCDGGDTAMGSMLRYGSEGAKQFYRMFVLKPEQAKAHQEGDIYIHDLDYYTLTTACCQINLGQLFHGGFSVGGGYLGEPEDIFSSAVLACIAIQANQNDQHGSQSIADFDYSMADGVRKTFSRLYTRNLAKCLALLTDAGDPEAELEALRRSIRLETGLEPRLGGCEDYLQAELSRLAERFSGGTSLGRCQEQALRFAEKETERAVYQAMEALLRILNAMYSRCGGRPPLSSIHYGMDTSPEGRAAVRGLLLAAQAGLRGGEVPLLPIQIFRLKEGINYRSGEPNYDLFQLACRCAAGGLSLRFAFLDAPFNLQYYDPRRPETETAYTACRTRVAGNVYDPGRQQCSGRGNLSATSVNLPRIALRARGDLDAFFDELDNKMELCIQQLKDRMEILSQKHVCSYPFLMGQGVWLDSGRLSRAADVRDVLGHGPLSVGFIGLAEALVALTGQHHGQSERSQRLGLEIIARMRARTDEECAKTGLNFSLLAAPARELGSRFASLDQERFGVVPGVTDRTSYTDSFHLPENSQLSAREKLQREAPYHALANGGHISYVEMDGALAQNPEAFEEAVRWMRESGIGCGGFRRPEEPDA